MKMQWAFVHAMAAICPVMAIPAAAQGKLDDKIDSNIADWVGTYKYLHEHPELSMEEKQTSALIASQLRKMGYQVTDHFGQYRSFRAIPGRKIGLRHSSRAAQWARPDALRANGHGRAAGNGKHGLGVCEQGAGEAAGWRGRRHACLRARSAYDRLAGYRQNDGG